ncbi:hypothetical protein LSH36_51g02031 [Paralvinella palmiformis]|uniref:Uncharacterized protein n=1 Tax=Paralvinella palmiformis TaxID=53620 RepID=A0AAD9NFK6_9ANNE|nr:hypothetical protein LSH36_51g02031 [Paralvinella palmiformis]
MDRRKVVVPKQVFGKVSYLEVCVQVFGKVSSWMFVFRCLLKTRLSWVVGITALSVTDTALNIWNVAYFSRSALNRCIVIGPPTFILWIFQVVFVSIGTVLFFFEAFNTVSIFHYKGETNFVPIHLELLATLPIKYIPIAAINFFIAKSREQYATALQNTIGACQFAYVFTRMLWYAHIEGKKVKKNDKYKIKRVFFMFVCVLFSCMMVFPITMWKEQNNIRLQDHHMKNVSVYFLNLPASIRNNLVKDELVDEIVKLQGLTIRHPYLVASLLTVRRAGSYGFNASFACHQNTTVLLPHECLPDKHNNTPVGIRFKFFFNENAPMCHLGEVVYNYAVLYGSRPTNQTCVPSTRDFYGGWELSYYYTRKIKHQQVTHLDLTSPWLGTWVIPVPTYQPQMIAVC